MAGSHQAVASVDVCRRASVISARGVRQNDDKQIHELRVSVQDLLGHRE